MILIINQKYYKIMKVCVTILILIMLLIGMTRVCAQEHRHKIDSVNNIVLYFKIDGATLDSTYMGNSKSLKKLDDWPFKRVARMEDMPVPIHRHTVSSINEVLTRWGGITTSDLDTSGVCYLEKYDAYYTYTSDFNMFYFIAESGEQVGNYVYLRKSVENGNIAVLTLRLTPGTDEWQIVSHWRSGS